MKVGTSFTKKGWLFLFFEYNWKNGADKPAVPPVALFILHK